MYWGLTALELMGRPDALDRNQVIEFVKRCQHSNGGFGGTVGHDPHLLYTLSALQILAILDALDSVDTEKALDCGQSQIAANEGSSPAAFLTK